MYTYVCSCLQSGRGSTFISSEYFTLYGMQVAALKLRYHKIKGTTKLWQRDIESLQHLLFVIFVKKLLEL